MDIGKFPSLRLPGATAWQTNWPVPDQTQKGTRTHMDFPWRRSHLLVESRWLLYYGHLAQPGEQSAHNRQVLGSNPRMSIIITAG